MSTCTSKRGHCDYLTKAHSEDTNSSISLIKPNKRSHSLKNTILENNGKFDGVIWSGTKILYKTLIVQVSHECVCLVFGLENVNIKEEDRKRIKKTHKPWRMKSHAMNWASF